MWAGVEASPHGWPDQIATTVPAPFEFQKDSEAEHRPQPVGTIAMLHGAERAEPNAMIQHRSLPRAAPRSIWS